MEVLVDQLRDRFAAFGESVQLVWVVVVLGFVLTLSVAVSSVLAPSSADEADVFADGGLVDTDADAVSSAVAGDEVTASVDDAGGATRSEAGGTWLDSPTTMAVHVLVAPEVGSISTSKSKPSSVPVLSEVSETQVPDSAPPTDAESVVPAADSRPSKQDTSVSTPVGSAPSKPLSAKPESPASAPEPDAEPVTAPLAETTVPTTRPTTVPTTRPTTVPTTRPTTVPTTLPQTVPTTVPTTRVVNTISQPLHTNLLVNGGFESVILPTDTLSHVSQAGWTSSRAGNVIETWEGAYEGVGAPEGRHLIELNGDGADSISQTVAVVPGAAYEVSFRHRGRVTRESMEVTVNGRQIVYSTAAAFSWGGANVQFSAGPGETSVTLAFTSLTSGSVGNLLDDVRLIRIR